MKVESLVVSASRYANCIIKNPLTKGFIQRNLYQYGGIRFIRDITIEIFRADRKSLCAERRWFYERFGLIKIISSVIVM